MEWDTNLPPPALNYKFYVSFAISALFSIPEFDGHRQWRKRDPKTHSLIADPPEIELETDRVHSGENKEAHLTCIIHGNPEPTVRFPDSKLAASQTLKSI